MPKMFRESPLQSLKAGHWVKLIGGASFQDLPTLRHLAIAYGLAGVDCLDLAADEAVVTAVREGLQVAENLSEEAKTLGFLGVQTPWIMVSLNDGEDPHFRKAFFDANRCPPDCPRPCESLCPAQAINHQGVIEQRCYGCGRCLPVCPLGLIQTQSHQTTPQTIANLLRSGQVSALEIHTQVGHQTRFQTLWQDLKPWLSSLKLLAISCPDHPDVLAYLTGLYQYMTPLPCPLLWQTDGRSMSGDIGKGTTHAAIRLAQKVLAANLPGLVQVAGGTNAYTVEKLAQLNLLAPAPHAIAGIAYGSFARSQLMPILEQLALEHSLETSPDLLWQAVAIADQLVRPLKLRAGAVGLTQA